MPSFPYFSFKTSTAYTDEAERLLLIIVRSSCTIRKTYVCKTFELCITVLRFTFSTSPTGLEKLSCAVY